MLPVLAFTACSDDDDSGSSYKLSLSGLWEEYPKNSESNTYLLLNTDKSGYQWVIDNEGRLTDQKPLTWTANKQYITLNFDDIGSLKIKYDLYGNILSLATGKTHKKIKDIINLHEAVQAFCLLHTKSHGIEPWLLLYLSCDCRYRAQRCLLHVTICRPVCRVCCCCCLL